MGKAEGKLGMDRSWWGGFHCSKFAAAMRSEAEAVERFIHPEYGATRQRDAHFHKIISCSTSSQAEPRLVE
jgi:hypothetical protein